MQTLNQYYGKGLSMFWGIKSNLEEEIKNNLQEITYFLNINQERYTLLFQFIV